MARTPNDPRRHPFIDALISKKNVMSAVILRDMRTRFFNHGLGFILVPVWPLFHMGILIGVHSGTGKGAPSYGDSQSLFIATGLVPMLSFMYMSRFMGWSVWQNRAMLNFPVVKALDVMWGRAFLEFISAFIVAALLMLILWIAGQNPWPDNVESATGALLATLFLAFGCGTFVGVISMFQPFLLTLWSLTIVALYLSSGTMFVASELPDNISYALSFNPITECIEWMRTAFYPSYSDKLVSVPYILSFGLGTMLLGLTIERVFRRKLIEG